jgi:hypothetical protein
VHVKVSHQVLILLSFLQLHDDRGQQHDNIRTTIPLYKTYETRRTRHDAERVKTPLAESAR